MNSFAHAKSLGLIGTDAEIVEQLLASGVTARPIALDELLYTLNMRGMLVKLASPGGGGEKWTGSIMALIGAINQVGSEPQKLAVAIWFSHITNSRNTRWDTTKPEHAAPFWQLYLAFGNQPGMPTVADFETITALGGGWLFADLTIEQYQLDRSSHEQAEIDRLSAEQLQAERQTNRTKLALLRATLVDALRWAETLDTAPTQQDVIDRIAASYKG